MSKSKIEKLLPEPQHSKEQKADVTSVSPTIAKPHVSGSVSLSATVPQKFAEAVKEFHQKHNVQLIAYRQSHNDWISVVVTGIWDDLVNLNKDCEKVAYYSE